MSLREPGNILDGKYEILRRLTGGGMSEVYLVRHLHLDERRVIKVLRPEDAADPSAQARFLRAARTASQIKHRNVAILYDYSSLADGSFYMVWEYVDGQDVGRWLDKHGPFPVDVALDLGIQALRGLEAIHSYGVIHRDISPDNLMLAQDVRGRITLKIIDLGLAKNLHPRKADLEVTQVGMFMGKLRYCSPEQAGMVEGAVLDHRSDLYSFAVVFYEMLCGKPPFESESSHGFVFKRLTEDPIPLAERVPGLKISRELDELLRVSLERDREKRHLNAVRMIQALEQVRGTKRDFSTQQVLVPPEVHEAIDHEPPSTRPASSVGPRSGSQLSKQEKDDLLAQINQASQRMSRTRGLLLHVEEALGLGNLEQARRLLDEIEAIDPKAKGVADLQRRLAAAIAAPPPSARVQETEALLISYFEHHQLALAKLAFESLVELAPNHPRRAEYEQRLSGLVNEADQDHRAEKTLVTAREALSRGDLAAAERGLTALRRAAPNGETAAAFEAELVQAKSSQQQLDQLALHRSRFERSLALNQTASAESELATLVELGASKVTLDLLRGQLAQARRLASSADAVKDFEARFALQLGKGDWFAAREVALEMEKAVEGHPRLSAMFAEAEALRHREERRQAIEQGERQVESLIAGGRNSEAAMALRILLKMDPENPKRKQLEKRIAALG